MIRSPLLSSLAGVEHGFLPEPDPVIKSQVSTVKQVHGDLLLWSDRLEKGEREADGIATRKAGLKVGVYSADCAPILVAALSEGGAVVSVMAVHGGWRGTAMEIGAKSFTRFAEELGSKAARFVAAIGPCISFESFEVGEEVVTAFPGSLDRGLARFLRMEENKKKFLFDLPGENRRQLLAAAERLGVKLEVEALGICTLREALPSYRRDGKKAGRILSYIGF